VTRHDSDDRDDRADDFRAIGELAEAFTTMVDLLTHRRALGLDVETLVAFGHENMPRTQHTGLILLERSLTHGGREQRCSGTPGPAAPSWTKDRHWTSSRPTTW
jgi:hypothetical protein